MKRVAFYAIITIGVLTGVFVVLVLATIMIADDEQDRQRIAYTVGYIYGMFLFIALGCLILFALYKITRLVFFSKEQPEDNVADKDGPIDRYLK